MVLLPSPKSIVTSWITVPVDAAGATDAVVGGLSLGGYMSLAFHRAHPERTRALLIIDTGPGYKNDVARDGWNANAIARADKFEAAKELQQRSIVVRTGLKDTFFDVSDAVDHGAVSDEGHPSPRSVHDVGVRVVRDHKQLSR